ncbi:bladder cancer-related bc10 [Pyrenophora seminiperda CCB06]|uniref:Bladder cancer-related bc10 n=1 Tax=Pyrenophora seminiperda CCB06 TaxID=1302712 RepID=A0A3M7LXR6_9PLEO|nr:bladder cancer-related bc10 [Pyrenophora seminiperda CCB06]
MPPSQLQQEGSSTPRRLIAVNRAGLVLTRRKNQEAQDGSVRTQDNASPVYLVLFISATYFLNRPCVYCSLLLFILVVALFDFHTPWFDAPLSDSAELALNGTVAETVSVLAQAANHTAQAVVNNAFEHLKGKMGSGQASEGQSYEFVKGLLGKKEWRIQCLDVLIRV